MTEENKARLMQAYRAAIAAGQDGIADVLEDVILGEMGQRPNITFRGSTPRTFDDIPTSPTYGSRYVVTCEADKGVES
jgi:hypothetical protein